MTVSVSPRRPNFRSLRAPWRSADGSRFRPFGAVLGLGAIVLLNVASISLVCDLPDGLLWGAFAIAAAVVAFGLRRHVHVRRQLAGTQRLLTAVRSELREAHRRLVSLTAMERHQPGVTIVFDEDRSVRRFTGRQVLEIGAGADLTAKARRQIHDDDYAEIERSLTRAASSPELEHPVSFRMRNAEGAWLQFEGTVTNALREPGIQGLLVQADDVTNSQRLLFKLRAQALYDPVTGLPNRSHVIDSLEEMLAVPERKPVALLLLDLDRFKLVNDTLGHGAGDQLLRTIARRLENVAKDGEMVGRLGGDEFTVLGAVDTIAQAKNLAAQMLQAVRMPIDLEGTETIIAASIGIALGVGFVTQGELLRKADAALYRAKARGRGQYAIFDDAEDPYTVERLRFEAELRQAVERDQLRLIYQPEVDLRSGKVVGVEALVRWDHPERGMLSPAEFVPLAEETGEILTLGRWILVEACREGSCWARMHRETFTISVNLSAREFEDRGLVSRVASALERSGLPAECLRLEITETALLRDSPVANATLAALKDLGVQLALDDFGIGYSSLSYLSRLPVDVVKIDQSFVAEMTVDPRQRAIVKAVVTLAHACGAQLVAEGIETHDQLAALQEWGCRSAQGFYFADGLSGEEITKLVVQRQQFQNAVNPLGAAPPVEASKTAAETAQFDSATGLPAKVLYEDRLTIALALAERRSEAIGIGLVSVRRTEGAVRPDGTLIAATARALRSALHDADTVAHLGGGQFALLLNDASSRLGVRSATTRCIIHLERELGETRGHFSGALGLVASMPPHQDQAELIAQAHTAHERALKRSTSDVTNSDEWASIAIYDSSFEDKPESLREVYTRAS